MSSTTKPTKADRKVRRRNRRHALIPGYREACREKIADMQEHNSHATSAEDRFSPSGFRVALKRLRHEFTRAIAGRVSA
jgi:hypothetical protein